MKAPLAKLIALAAALLSAAFAVGCPVYSDNAYPAAVGCIYATDCPLGYLCNGGYCILGPSIGGGGRDAGVADARVPDAPADAPSNGEGAAAAYCGNPADCKMGETCSVDGICHSGDCSSIACINQFQCAVVTSGFACVHADGQACGADAQCANTARCVDGRCTPVADLCTDRTQCAPGNACAAGKCVPICATDSDCPSGFRCHHDPGVCIDKKSCTITSDCAYRDVVCVDGACVPRCAAVGACADGGRGACVDNGCIPSQKPLSACQVDGSMTGCAAGQICLHHACYTSCQAPNANACSALASTPLCKMVTVGSATYSICGTTTTLGSECDPTLGTACAAGKTCVDGFCH
jgi:Cys-rich repeat protein